MCGGDLPRQSRRAGTHIKEMTAVHLTLPPQARILVGLAAAAGAFGLAAMMSGATAPTARADDYTAIISAVDGDFTAGQAELTSALSDFGSISALTAFFDGVDDDALAAPNNLLVGSVEALANESVTGSEPFGLLAPASFSDALSFAESAFNVGETYITEGATDFAAGDYGATALLDLFGADYVSVVPLEELLLGAAASL